jgi:hypothetical protein
VSARRPLQLKNEDGSDRRGNSQKTLRHPRDEIDLVSHVRSPLIESIERHQIAPPATAQQTEYLTVR